MPIYTFRNKKTDEVFDKMMSYSSKIEYLDQNPDIEALIGAPSVGDPVRLGVRRTDDGFREVLSKISSANYRSNLSDKLSRK